MPELESNRRAFARRSRRRRRAASFFFACAFAEPEGTSSPRSARASRLLMSDRMSLTEANRSAWTSSHEALVKATEGSAGSAGWTCLLMGMPRKVRKAYESSQTESFEGQNGAQVLLEAEHPLLHDRIVVKPAAEGPGLLGREVGRRWSVCLATELSVEVDELGEPVPDRPSADGRLDVDAVDGVGGGLGALVVGADVDGLDGHSGATRVR